MKRREYQKEALKALPRRRFFALLWRRQGGKSTWISEATLMVMMKTPGITCVYASASLLLGREIIYKDSQAIAKVLREVRSPKSEVRSEGLRVECADRGSGKIITTEDADALAEVFEMQRLEFRLYHDNTTYSRTQVIAPNPATARGWTGWVFIDEFGFIRDFRDLWEAVEPIVSTDRNFHLIMATTPPPDDSHYSYELTAPPVGLEFKVNPAGNWYESEAGVPIHRVDVYDGHAAGVKLYDLKTGEELTPAEHFGRALDKDAWRRNYGIQHVAGGTSACGLMQIDNAQRRGFGQCGFFYVDREEDFARGLDFLAEHMGGGEVGLGLDVATTTKESSNPTSLTVMEANGLERLERGVFCWKTRDPEVAMGRVEKVVDQVAHRVTAGRPRRLCVDATSERYFAEGLKKRLLGKVPVELIVQSVSVERPGSEPVSMKTHLGDVYVALLDDNQLTLPPERYVKDDHRMVRKDRGSYVCEPAADGKHGDTFDSGKLANWALKVKGEGWARAAALGGYQGGTA
jgi:hypothetical protein